MEKSFLENVTGIDLEQNGISSDVQAGLATAAAFGAVLTLCAGLGGVFSEKPTFPLNPEQAAALTEAHENFSILCEAGLSVSSLPVGRRALVDSFAPSGTVLAVEGGLTDGSEWICTDVRDGRAVTSHRTAINYDGTVWYLIEENDTLSFVANKGILGAKWYASAGQ